MACGLGSTSLSPMAQTLTPLSAAVEGTATAQAKDVGGAGDELATAVAKATATERRYLCHRNRPCLAQ